MIDQSKYTTIVRNKSNAELAKYYRTLMKRFVDSESPSKSKDLKVVIGIIKEEWMKRLEEGDQDGLPDEGLMSTMGYRVGDTQGIKGSYRRMIMKEILEGPIPFVGNPAYMREWGEDGSIERYNKMKRFLNSEINSPVQKYNYRAISEWKEDLQWLEEVGAEYIK